MKATLAPMSKLLKLAAGSNENGCSDSGVNDLSHARLPLADRLPIAGFAGAGGVRPGYSSECHSHSEDSHSRPSSAEPDDDDDDDDPDRPRKVRRSRVRALKVSCIELTL